MSTDRDFAKFFNPAVVVVSFLALLALGCTSHLNQRGPASYGPPSPIDVRPKIHRITSDGAVVWDEKSATIDQSAPILTVGSTVYIEGENFGAGPDTDLSKVMFGKVRALERDLGMYRGNVNPLEVLMLQNIFQESPKEVTVGPVSWPQTWKKDVISWTDTLISVRVPVTASAGPLVVQVQRRSGSLKDADGKLHMIPDPITERVEGFGSYGGPDKYFLEVGTFATAATTQEIPIRISNPEFQRQVQEGEKIYWAFDFNIGFTHSLLGVGWDNIFSGNAVDRIAGGKFDPVELIGAVPISWVRDSIPAIANQTVEYPISPMPAPFWEFSQSASIRPTGWVGYVQGQSVPTDLFHPATYHTGFSCVTCHAAPVTYEDGSGRMVTRLFNGIPNPKWSMKFATVGPMSGVRGLEARVQSSELPAFIDKSQLLYALYPGTADMTLVRSAYEVGSFFHNDFLFSPTAIPIITRHTPVRRALSRTEAIAGFEGSYIHSEEPDGAFGAHTADAIKNFTSYMSTLDRDHDVLIRLGLYRWLKFAGHLGEIGGISEGDFMKAKSASDFPQLQASIEAGRSVYERECLSCHAANFGTNTDESMIPLTVTGSFFSPTKWQRQQGSIRTAMIRELYWVQKRGLLHDGHVRSPDVDHVDSARLLVSPDRCLEGSPLYNQLYTLSPGSFSHAFRIPKGTAEQERATRAHSYFVDLPATWGQPEDHRYLYWDYQAMRSSFGVVELGLSVPTPLPAVPHPYCVKSDADADSLVHYLMTL